MKELAIAYCEKAMGKPISLCKPRALRAGDVMKALWPLNDIFHPVVMRIRSIRYRACFEEDADRAIEDFVALGGAEAWENLPPEVWRVLLERHQQWLIVAAANELAGDDIVTYLPADLAERHWLPALMLDILHGMTLPWPAADRSQSELRAPEPPPNPRRH